jgi:hypothetical protein
MRRDGIQDTRVELANVTIDHDKIFKCFLPVDYSCERGWAIPIFTQEQLELYIDWNDSLDGDASARIIYVLRDNFLVAYNHDGIGYALVKYEAFVTTEGNIVHGYRMDLGLIFDKVKEPSDTTLTRQDIPSWIETVYDALDEVMDNLSDERRDDVNSAMAYIIEELGYTYDTFTGSGELVPIASIPTT